MVIMVWHGLRAQGDVGWGIQQVHLMANLKPGILSGLKDFITCEDIKEYELMMRKSWEDVGVEDQTSLCVI